MFFLLTQIFLPMSVQIVKIKENTYSVNKHQVNTDQNGIIQNLNDLSFNEELAIKDFIKKEKLGIKIQQSFY